MSIKLTKDATITPDVYSSGDGSDPVTAAMILDGSNSPAEIIGSPAGNLYVWANDFLVIGSYSDISVAISGHDTGVTWELSLDGATNWQSTINLADLDVSTGYKAVQIYARVRALNDGSVATQNYISADITITATSNP